MKKAVAIFTVMLTGCAAGVMSSNPRSVVIQVGSERGGDAQALADSECRKYNRYAKFNRKMSTMEWSFDCVD